MNDDLLSPYRAQPSPRSFSPLALTEQETSLVLQCILRLCFPQPIAMYVSFLPQLLVVSHTILVSLISNADFEC